jgi:peptidoglycan/LPS O-acetylase OafA/YrhL
MTKFIPLVGLRIVLAIIVIFEHVSDSISAQFDMNVGPAVLENSHFFWSYSPLLIVRNGAFAVAVFFTLSGFVLSHYLNQSKNILSFDLIAFALRRYLRFSLPVLGCLLILFPLLQIDHSLSSGYLGHWGAGFVSITMNDTPPTLLETVYQGLVGTPLFGLDHYNPVLWTIAVEFYGSLLLLLVFACWKNTLPKYVRIGITSVTFIFIMMLIYQTLFAGFLIGFAGYFLYLNLSKKHLNSSTLTFSLMVLCILFLMHSPKGGNTNPFNLLPVEIHSQSHYFYYSLSGLCLLLLCIISKHLSQVMASKTLVFWGKRSFSIYLCHYPIISIIGISINELAGEHHYFAILSNLTLTILLSCIVGHVFYHYIEAPSYRLSQRFTHNQYLYLGNKGNR